MISHNLCYSTCLGSLKQLFDPNTKRKRFGVSQAMDIDIQIILDLIDSLPQKEAIKRLQKYIYVSPNKVAFVRKSVRQGIIPRILLEFLMSRVMIKNSVKLYDDQSIRKLLTERQTAIKLFMNVMYGYAGASFSGRMPNSEIADSVVEIAKYSLKTCIDLLDKNPAYGAGKVIYGDTDSLFLELKGRTHKEAFEIGEKIARDLTSRFPYPMELKFQKIYDGLVLVSKKRYYGRRIDKLGGVPKFEGKGLQCVRRDGIDLTCKLMEQTLNMLLSDRNLSQLKNYFQKEYSQIKSGYKLTNQYALAKQVKLLKYGESSSKPAHGEAALHLKSIDPMLVPRYGERMKYVVIKGSSKKVKDNALPMYLFRNQELDLQYYCNKLILPPLQRVFTSMVSLEQWTLGTAILYNPLQTQLFKRSLCPVCDKVDTKICYSCSLKVDDTLDKYLEQGSKIGETCRRCIRNSNVEEQSCVQFNCQELFIRKQAKAMYSARLGSLKQIQKILKEYRREATDGR